jgi:hypothetical protein
MAKDKISQYAFTPAANTDIGGINIDEGCAPSGINNAIRTLMTQIRDLQAGVSGDTIPLTAGGTGSGTAASARAALGLAIGVDVLGYVTPGSTGNVLQSNGSIWTSGAAAGFPAGTVMLFAQTSAPTGWTKDTTNYNNSGLRIVTGTASTGGSVDFTTAFASKTPTGSITITAVSGSAGNTTLTTPQIPSHTHTANAQTAVGRSPVASPLNTGSATAGVTGSTGGDGAHSHPFSFTSGTGTFAGDAINLAVKYVDVIRATKD